MTPATRAENLTEALQLVADVRQLLLQFKTENRAPSLAELPMALENLELLLEYHISRAPQAG